MPVEVPRIQQPAVLDDRHRHVLPIQRQPHFTFAARGLLPPFRERAQRIRRRQHRIDGETRVAKRGKEGAGQRIGRGRGLVQVPGDDDGVLREAAGTAGAAQVVGERLATDPSPATVCLRTPEPDASPPGRTRTSDAGVSAELDAGS